MSEQCICGPRDYDEMLEGKRPILPECKASVHYPRPDTPTPAAPAGGEWRRRTAIWWVKADSREVDAWSGMPYSDEMHGHEVAGRFNALEAEINALTADLAAARAEVEALTPGGSEFVMPNGWGNAIRFIRDRLETAGKLAAERNAARAEAEQLRAKAELADWWAESGAELPAEGDAARAEEVALWLDYLDNLRESNPESFDASEIERTMQADIRAWLARYDALTGRQEQGGERR